jgi:hypothetical protein
MKVFQLSAAVTVSAYTVVEAETLEEAIRIAEGRSVQLGGNGSGAYADESWIIEDADGAPQDIHQDI